MTWTEGTISLFNDSLIICNGYLGITIFCLLAIFILVAVFLYGYALWLMHDK